MRIRTKILTILLIVTMLTASYVAISTIVGVQAMGANKTQLENVRDYTSGWAMNGTEAVAIYAIDGGALYVGGPSLWSAVPLPDGVIAGAVAVDPDHPGTLYVGAANELALYLSRNGGSSWQRIRLDRQYVGGITDIAINSAQRTLYLATDTAGIFRMRDVGSSMLLSGHTMIDGPVLQVVADQQGAGLIFARTTWTVYRGMNNGQQWLPLDGLATTPTALAVANGQPATVYLGTTDHGLLQSTDGFTWQEIAGPAVRAEASRLQVDAIAVDPLQPPVLYVAMSYLFGNTTIHQSSLGVAMTTDRGAHWTTLTEQADLAVTDLIPVAGTTGAVFALTNQSRSPLALGAAPAIAANSSSSPNYWTTPTQPVGMVSALAWLVAAAAAVALCWLLLQEQQQPILATIARYR
ncbi:MAG: hypothetical protein R2867_09345 [Caldilineaceae bacterium]